MRLCVVLLLLGACYNPAYTSGMFKCAQTSDCPGDFVCSDGLCVNGTAADLQGVSADLTSSPADLTGKPCTSGTGTKVSNAGQDVWACPGKFNSQAQQNKLCGPGYAVCTAGTNVDAAACDKLGGFFLLDDALSADPQGIGGFSFNCGSSSGQFKDLLGCGSAAGFRTPTPCSGLTGGAACQSPLFNIQGWDCKTNFADASNSNDSGGVLCCRL